MQPDVRFELYRPDHVEPADVAPDPPPAGDRDYDWASSDLGWSADIDWPQRATINQTLSATEGVSASPYRWTDPLDIPPRQWLYGRHFIRKFLSVTVSAGGIGKSSLELLDAVSMTSGRNLLTGKKTDPCACWYWNGEDPLEELQRRVQAIALHYGLTEDDLGGRLFLDSGRQQRIVVAREDRRNGITVNRPLVASMIQTLTAHKIDVLILDPFISAHAVPENDNGAIDQVAKELAGVADAANCAVEVVHHVRKSNNSELTVDDARGAVALMGAARSARILNAMTADEAAKAGIDPTQRRLYFRGDNGKSNLAPPASDARWHRLVSVGLGNGRAPYPEDSVGVVAAWSWPDAFAGLNADHLKLVQNKVAGGEWRADAQSGAWVGKAVAEVLGLDLDQPADKARVKALIKTWVKNGSLVEAERQDEARKSRRFLEVGVWVET
jgi:hypothetical protein